MVLPQLDLDYDDAPIVKQDRVADIQHPVVCLFKPSKKKSSPPLAPHMRLQEQPFSLSALMAPLSRSWHVQPIGT